MKTYPAAVWKYPLISRLRTGSGKPLAYEESYYPMEYSDLLSDAEYRLFRRIAVDRYSMKEAAYELGISVEACKKRVQRIRAKLQQQILDTLDEGVLQ